MSRRIDLTKPESYPSLEALLDGDEQRMFDFALARDWQGQPLAPVKVVERIESGLAPLDNMGLSNRSSTECGGYDTLEAILWGTWAGDRLEVITGILENARDTQGETSLGMLLGEPIEVWPGGARRGLYCSWVFRWSGITVGIVNKKASDKAHWGVWITIGSVACMDQGGQAAWQAVCGFLEKLGFHIAGNRVSRVDGCVDLPEVDTHLMTQQYVLRACVMRGRLGETYEDGLRFTGFRRGSGQRILLRVYDKKAELKGGKEDAVKESLLIERRWGGVVPKFATRVEFQLRREAITDFAIDTVEQFFERAGEVFGWLSSSWFRLTDKVPDRGNTQHFGPSALWADVQAKFAAAFGKALPPNRVKKSLTGDASRLGKQAIGCLTSLMAVVGEVPERIEDVVACCARLVHAAGERLLDEVYAKRVALECLVGGVRMCGEVQPKGWKPWEEFVDFA